MMKSLLERGGALKGLGAGEDRGPKELDVKGPEVQDGGEDHFEGDEKGGELH